MEWLKGTNGCKLHRDCLTCLESKCIYDGIECPKCEHIMKELTPKLYYKCIKCKQIYKMEGD